MISLTLIWTEFMSSNRQNDPLKRFLLFEVMLCCQSLATRRLLCPPTVWYQMLFSSTVGFLLWFWGETFYLQDWSIPSLFPEWIKSADGLYAFDIYRLKYQFISWQRRLWRISGSDVFDRATAAASELWNQMRGNWNVTLLMTCNWQMGWIKQTNISWDGKTTSSRFSTFNQQEQRTE